MKNVSMIVTFSTTIPLDAWELTALPPPLIFDVSVAFEAIEVRATDADDASVVVEAWAPLPLFLPLLAAVDVAFAD